MGRFLAILLVTGLGVGGTWLGRARVETLAEKMDTSEALLYLPNGKHLKLASLGQAPLLADMLYLWAIQYYSSYDHEDRYRYVEHVFGEVVTELDPHYVDAYALGALIMSVEARDLDAALRLLDKGFEHNPDTWILPWFAGWECFHAGQFRRAAEYFEAAAAVPDAPGFVLRVRAGMYTKSGDFREAVSYWRLVLDDPRSDEASRHIAERHIRDLTVRADLQDIEAAIAGYREKTGKLPARLQQLVGAKVIAAVPLDPDGAPYTYDPATGEVTSAAARILGHD